MQLFGSQIRPGVGARLAAQRAAGHAAGQAQALAGNAIGAGSAAADVGTGGVLDLPLLSSPTQFSYLGSFTHEGNRVAYAGGGQFLSALQEGAGSAQMWLMNTPSVLDGRAASVATGPVTVSSSGWTNGFPQLAGMGRINNRVMYAYAGEYGGTQAGFVASRHPTTLAANTGIQATTGFPSWMPAARGMKGQFYPIPAAYQSLFDGDDAFVVNACFSIVSEDSLGPSFCTFNTNNVTGSGTIPTQKLMLMGNYQDPAGGTFDPFTYAFWQASGSYGSGECATAGSAGIVPGTRTVIFVGHQGTTQQLYTTAPGACNEEGQGFKASPYRPEIWCVDLRDLVDVKNGLRQPYSIRPYNQTAGSNGWSYFGWALPEGTTRLGSCWKSGFYGYNAGFFEPETMRLYLCNYFTVHVWQITV